MSATDEERIIAVAAAMMRQSRSAGGVVHPVGQSDTPDPSLRNRRELNGWRDVGLLVHARRCSLSLGSHSTPSLERFRERVVRIKRQIGVERP